VRKRESGGGAKIEKEKEMQVYIKTTKASYPHNQDTNDIFVTTGRTTSEPWIPCKLLLRLK
jgi:hypothetical protein